ncbi:hypothetical protein [Nitratidesulfovibrio sp. 1201_IL3209]|uniref:hypothetical protein n=1 Tax=Nitratidesulfovibrio sp. 1201_IL3209 TaxID=3084053 RepID=UPI002FDB3620
MAEPELYWPESLPQQPLNSGTQRGIPNLILRSTMDKGPARQRQYTSAAKRRLSYPLYLTMAQVATLEEFLETVPGQSFWLPDPMDDTKYLLVDLVPESQESVATLQPMGTGMTVTLTLEAWPHVSRDRT